MSNDKPPLSIGLSVSEFNNTYYYAEELKAFARTQSIRIGNFRKIELEGLIREFLTTGTVPDAKPVLPRKQGQPSDELSAETIVTNYVGDKTTKGFLLQLVEVQNPNVKPKSDQWYWLNDWRRKQQKASSSFTYQDVANKLLDLMQTSGRLPQIPYARMNNFITNFRADPANYDANRETAMKAWELVKNTNGPKTYETYRNLQNKTDTK